MWIQAPTDYAMRILLHLHEHSGQLHTAMSVAQAVGLSYSVFTKTATTLKEHGLITTVLGQSGGYALGKPADEISVYDVFLATQGEMQINPHQNKARHEAGAVHVFFQGLQTETIAIFSKQTIADFGKFRNERERRIMYEEVTCC